VGLFPCSMCSKRYRGPAQTLYPSVLKGRDRYSAHLRLCPDCYEEIHEQLTAHAVQLALEPQDDLTIPLCAACGAPSRGAKDHTVYVTVYPRGEERVDFLGALHDECADGAIAAWRLVPGG
jgi:hypothetical protein